MEEQRIYVVVAATVQANGRNIVQPAGRQIAQACHVVSKLRSGTGLKRNFVSPPTTEHPHGLAKSEFEPITTIILQGRDSKELEHILILADKKKLKHAIFEDTNPQYGDGEHTTAIAFVATANQNHLVADYLPLWGAQ